MFFHNGHYVFIPLEGQTLLTVLKFIGKHVSRFCYHEILAVAGNCRACLVEIENFDKPVAACVAELESGQSIWTESLFAKKARENVFEILLINHPLDCPICDQAGECDLQDQSRVFGNSTSRYFFKKRSVFDKNCDFLIKTIMTRCIHCTRCVRFNNLIGNSKIGILNRGTSSTIGNYFFKQIKSELLGNVIDLCPVGALTARINAFATRPWEVTLIEGVDLVDGLGTSIYLGIKDLAIVRVLPKPNKRLNGNLITDTCRFFFKTLTKNRLNNLQIWNIEEQRYENLEWYKFFQEMDRINKSCKQFFILINEKLNLLTINKLKKIVNISRKKLRLYQSQINSKNNVYSFYTSSPLDIFEKQLNTCFLYSNLGTESTILNFKLKVKYQKTLLNILCIGYVSNSSVGNLTNLNSKCFFKKIKAKSVYSQVLLLSLFSISLFTKSFSSRANLFNSTQRHLYTSKYIGIATFCNEEGLKQLNIPRYSLKEWVSSVVFYIRAQDTLQMRKNLLKHKFVHLWLHSYKPLFGSYTFLVPVLAFFEEDGLYINLEQKNQLTKKALSSNYKHKDITSILLSVFKI